MIGYPHHLLCVGDSRMITDWQRGEDPEMLFIRRIAHRSNVYDE